MTHENKIDGNGAVNQGESEQCVPFLRNASEKAAKVTQKIRDVASDVSCEVSDLGNRAESSADRAIGTLGEKLHGYAETLREKAPTEGSVGSAARSVAGGLESGADYLSKHGVSDMAGEVTALVRRHPLRALWVGIGAGVLLGSMFLRSNKTS